jgi:hypothetical protein
MQVLFGFSVVSMCYDHTVKCATLADRARTVGVRAKAWTTTSADAASSLEASTLSYMLVSLGDYPTYSWAGNDGANWCGKALSSWKLSVVSSAP